MENITALILGILLTVLPAGGPGDAGGRIKDELRLEGVRVIAEGQHTEKGRVSWKNLKVIFRPWETDAGTVGKAEWDFGGVEALKAADGWKLESLRGATVTLTFDEEDLWETAAMAGTRVSITGVWIEEKKITVRGAYSAMLVGIPIEFEVTGRPGARENTVVLEGKGEAKVFRLGMGEWAREKILGMVNPLMDLEGFDIISAYSEPYLKNVDKEIRFEAVAAGIKSGKLVVECGWQGEKNKDDKDGKE